MKKNFAALMFLAAGIFFALQQRVAAADVPPDGAVVLFDGHDLSKWITKADKSDAKWKILEDGSAEVNGTGDIVTKDKFKDFKLHVEFWCPNMPPEKTGQERGNSGVYLQDRYEIQVLDSFGVTPTKGDCGAVYDQKAPDVNACKPPEQWQTFDITFRAARFDGEKVTEKARVTVEQNGQVIQKDVEINGPTPAGAKESDKPGPIRLQDHGHPVRYRNVWIIPAAEQAAEKPPSEDDPQPWNQMQYGSILSATLENRNGGKQYTNKAIMDSIGTEKNPVHVAFDTELLRYGSGWEGKFLHFHNVAFSGQHVATLSPRGTILWAATGQHPGISLSDDFNDPRPDPFFGPLPRDKWGHYNGLFRNGEKVVFSYTIGGANILEMPRATVDNDNTVIWRDLEIAPADKEINILVGQIPKPTTRPSSIPKIVYKANVDLKTNDGMMFLTVPPHKEMTKVVIAMGKGPLPDKVEPNGQSLEALCHGGPASWPEAVTTKGTLGTGNGPYVVDTITVPEENPYHSWMRFGGFDFFSDGRAAVCTWSGDVWIVSGIDAKLDHVTWKRFAAGLFQPLGLKIVKDEIYVLGRDQITRLRDLNGDGEADQYENFNNDCMVSPSFHEFALDLQCDSKGNFYYAKGGAVHGGGKGWERVTPHNGTILQVSPDGKKLDVFATGVRAPNGMSMGPHDEITVSDNQGTWVPVCRISFVTKGSFLGVPDNSHLDPPPSNYGDPICWIPYPDVDNSSGGGVWVTSDQWGPFKDRMLHTSYGQCSLFLVMTDKVDDQTQGALVQFPNLEFDSGIDRGRINPSDGQVYLTGLRGWQTRGAKDACFQRVRYTGKPVNMPTSFHVKENGVEVGFTSPVDPETAGDPDSYDVEQWNYVWAVTYGSPEVHVDDPKQQGRQSVKVTEAKVSADKKSVLLVIPDLQPVMQMKIGMNINAADGEAMKYEVDGTISRVPNWHPKPSTQPSAAPAVSVK